MHKLSNMTVSDDEARAFGISDRELIKTLYKKVVMLEERLNESEHNSRLCREWIAKNEGILFRLNRGD